VQLRACCCHREERSDEAIPVRDDYALLTGIASSALQPPRNDDDN
jgi:hypothetical protein